jgi:hypothetical protein
MAIAAISIGSAATALAQSTGNSDNRATPVPGNVNTCFSGKFGLNLPAEVGGIPVHQASGPGNSSPGSFITVTVQTNTGLQPTSHPQPGQGQEVNVTVPTGVTVLAVVIMGGGNYNLYSPPAVPSTLAAPQHYIAPFNNGGNVPNLSHWIVCFTYQAPPIPPPGTGNISVSKIVLLPTGVIVTAPPPDFTATVDCGSAHTATVTLPGEGGVGSPNPVFPNGIQPGTTCTVNENPPLPPNVSVSYSPPEASTTGVTIVEGTTIGVTVTNDFSDAPVEMGILQLKKVVSNHAGAATPSDWTANVNCEGVVTPVTMPGAGGPGTPVLHPNVGDGCTVQEINLPAGWSATYSVNGGPATSTPPTINVESTATFTVTITNLSADEPGLPTTGEPASGGGLPLLGLLVAGLAAAVAAGGAVLARR